MKSKINNLYFSAKENILNIGVNIKKHIFGLLLALILIIGSGNCFVNFGATGLVKVLVYVISFITLLIIFILTRDVSPFVNKKIDRKTIFELAKGYVFRPDVFFIIAIIFVSCLNFVISFATGASYNINSIVGAILCFCSSFLIVQIYSKKTFFRCLSNTIFAISIISLLFYAFINISKTSFNTGSFWSPLTMYDSYFYVFFDYGDAGYVTQLPRLMGMFWEPSVFANFLIIGLVAELFYLDKTNWIKIPVFVICLVLTRSTGGYILLVLVALAYICKHLKGWGSSYFLIFVLLSTLLIAIFNKQILEYLAKILPNVFGKMNKPTSSFITRLDSPLYYFRVFAERPIFGYGFDLARVRYLEICPPSIDASTSTFPIIIASTGIIGIFYSLFAIFGTLGFGKEKNNLCTRIILLVLFLLMSNTQSHIEVIGLSAIYYFGIKETSSFKLENDAYKNAGENTIFHKIQAKSDTGSFSSNVIGAIVIKVVSIIVGLLTVPAFSSFFGNDSTYGIWLTIISILTIILNLDFGVTNGLKNRLIEAKKNDVKHVKKIISNSYLITLILSVILFLGFSIIIWTLDWNTILKISTNDLKADVLKLAMTFILLTICLQVVLRNVVAILSAFKKIVLANSLMLITNICLVISALIFKNVNADKVLFMSILYVIFVSLPLILASLYAFTKICKNCFPSFKLCDKKIIKNLTNIGSKFFIIQICNIVLWGFNDFFISNLYGPSDVVSYVKLYQLFSTIVSLYAIIQPILWVYIAKEKKDLFGKKMKALLKVAYFLTGIIAFGIIVAGVFCQPILNIWLGSDTINCTFEIVLPFVLYGVIYAVFSSVTVLCNSLEVLKSFTIVAIVIGVIKVPLVYLGKIILPDFGWTLVMWVNVILIIPYTVVPLISVIKHFKKAKKGLNYEKKYNN